MTAKPKNNSIDASIKSAKQPKGIDPQRVEDAFQHFQCLHGGNDCFVSLAHKAGSKFSFWHVDAATGTRETLERVLQLGSVYLAANGMRYNGTSVTGRQTAQICDGKE